MTEELTLVPPGLTSPRPDLGTVVPDRTDVQVAAGERSVDLA